MGLFKSKKLVVDDSAIVGSIAVGLSQALQSLIENNVVSKIESREIWALIMATASSNLKSDKEVEYLHDFIKYQIPDLETRRVFDAHQDIPHYAALYVERGEVEPQDLNSMVTSLNELIIQISTEPNVDPYKASLELSLPLFTHYLSRAAIRADDKSDDFEKIAELLSMAFGLLIGDYFKRSSLYSSAANVRRIFYIEKIFCECIVMWGFMAFLLIKYEGQDET